MNRKEVLTNANKCVNGDREQDYGSPENNFTTIATMWNAYIGNRAGHAKVVKLDAKDVAAMLCLLKVARISSGHAKCDNWIDLAGYAACGGELESNSETVTLPMASMSPVHRRSTSGGNGDV